MNITIKFDDAAVGRRIAAIRSGLGPALLASVEEGRNFVRAKIMTEKLQGQVLGRRTGTLLRSIQEGGGAARMTGELSAQADLGTNVWYGRMWELEGMRAHEVVARGNALAFIWHGEQRFFKRVNIPAQAARPFVRPALEESAGAVERIVRARISRAMGAA